MLTLVRPAWPATGPSQPQPASRRCAWTDLPAAPRLRLVGSFDQEPAPLNTPTTATHRRSLREPGPTAEQQEVLTIALDRMIDEAMRQLTAERARARARLRTAAAAPSR